MQQQPMSASAAGDCYQRLTAVLRACLLGVRMRRNAHYSSCFMHAWQAQHAHSQSADQARLRNQQCSTKKRVNEQRSNALCLGTKQPPPSSSNITETGSEANNVIMLSLSLNKSILQRNQNNASSSEFELQNAILQRTQF